MNKKTVFLTKAAVIGALYAVLTLMSAAFGIAYGEIQFRFSEALCILPIFTASAVPGLTVGCVVANIFSSVNPVDTVVGSLATLIAAYLTRKTRHITIKGFPIVSMLFPILLNALFVGAEIAFFAGEGAFVPTFCTASVSVGLGEAAVIFTLGVILYSVFRKNARLGRLISD